MADFSTLIASIEATIKQNGVQAITGQVLQDELLAMVAAINQLKQDTLEGYSFYGEALPNGATRVVTQNTFFLAGAGSYTINGNAVTISDGGISVIVYDCVNDEISTYQLFAYDANPTSGSGNAVTSGGVYNALAGKQALVPAATEGNLAEFDNAGQVRDAGLATSDLATKDGIASLDSRMDDAEEEIVALQEPDYHDINQAKLCGQPMKLFGAGTPQESIVPDNWIQLADGGYDWNGVPSAIGQEYINTAVASGGHYIAVRDTNMGLKWYNC